MVNTSFIVTRLMSMGYITFKIAVMVMNTMILLNYQHKYLLLLLCFVNLWLLVTANMVTLPNLRNILSTNKQWFYALLQAFTVVKM